MGHQPRTKIELDEALAGVLNAQKLLVDALDVVEKKHNRQKLQDTLNIVNHALDSTRSSNYGYKD